MQHQEKSEAISIPRKGLIVLRSLSIFFLFLLVFLTYKSVIFPRYEDENNYGINSNVKDIRYESSANKLSNDFDFGKQQENSVASELTKNPNAIFSPGDSGSKEINTGDTDDLVGLQENIAESNISSLKDKEVEEGNPNLNDNDSSSSCEPKKRIIINVNHGGLGNRMVSLVSSIMLGLVTNRVVELEWSSNKLCGTKYSELFNSRPQEKLDYQFHPFVFEKDPHMPRQVKRTETICNIFFDQTFNYTHLSFLTEKGLFVRLDNECKIIHIQSNIYFGHLIMNNIGKHLKTDFGLTSPFHHLSQIAFHPKNDMKDKVDKFISEKFKNKKWLSIHARGYYDKNDKSHHTDNAIECANQLLSQGDISYVFFASESERLNNLAREKIKASNLVMIPHDNTYVTEETKEGDSMKIRQSMDIALMEWYIIGKATYCMASEISASTFSKTSVVYGPCSFIHYFVEGCSLDNIITGHQKEKLIISPHKHIVNDVPRLPDIIMQNKLWNTVSKTQESVEQQCLPEEWSHAEVMRKFWGYNDNRHQQHQQQLQQQHEDTADGKHSNNENLFNKKTSFGVFESYIPKISKKNSANKNHDIVDQHS